MPLDANITEQLRMHLRKIVEPIELGASLDDSPKSQELWGLLGELAALSDAVRLVRLDSTSAVDERRPSFCISRVSDPSSSVRFAGIPLGHEFTSLVLALLQVGGHPSTVPEPVLDQVRALSGDLHFETFYSLSCQSCPDVVQALNLMSVVNPGITHTAIDGALFPDEVGRRQVLSVPAVFLNGELFDVGRMAIDDILSRLDSGVAEREAATIDAKDPFDVLIVGGGPAGAAAAVYAARKGIRTGMVVERFGGQVLDTAAIENFISVPYTEGPQFAAALERHVADHDVDVMHRQRASRLVPATGDAGDGDEGRWLHTVELESGASLQARTVILSTGARWRHIDVPGESEYRNRGVTYCPHCDGPLFKGKRVAVIGGGNSGVEAAIDLAGLASHVTLLEFDSSLRADDVLQRKLRSLVNVDVLLGVRTTEVVGDGQRVVGLRFEDLLTGDLLSLDLDGVFVQIGLLPNTEWLGGAVACTDRGEVVIDDRGQTSVPGVVAAGDCTTAPFKQIVVAMGAGSTAALTAFDHLIRSTAPALDTSS